ncbi:hypothetical protein VTO42DRAFT_5770 [Malbranchea cinnamomea]
MSSRKSFDFFFPSFFILIYLDARLVHRSSSAELRLLERRDLSTSRERNPREMPTGYALRQRFQKLLSSAPGLDETNNLPSRSSGEQPGIHLVYVHWHTSRTTSPGTRCRHVMHRPVLCRMYSIYCMHGRHRACICRSELHTYIHTYIHHVLQHCICYGQEHCLDARRSYDARLTSVGNPIAGPHSDPARTYRSSPDVCTYVCTYICMHACM